MQNYLRFLVEHRRFLAFGLAAAFFSSFGQTFFVGQFNNAIRHSFALSHTTFGGIYAAATLASALSLVRLGRLIDESDLRVYTVVVIAGIAAASALIGSAWAAWALLPALFLLRLTGQGLLSHISATTMARYFDHTRGKAMSIAGLGYPIGEAILPPLAVFTIVAFGWRAVWFGITGIILFIALPTMLWLLHGHAARHDAHERRLRADDVENGTAARATARSWARAEVLRDPRFYLIMPAVLAPPFIVTGMFFHQNQLAAAKGWSLGLFAASFAAFALVQLVVSIAAGPLIDRFGACRIVQRFLVPMTLGLVVIAIGRVEATAFVFMALVGGTTGAAGAILGAMWAELYGVRHHGAIRAMTSSIGVMSTAASPLAMGAALDAGVTMEVIAWISAAWCVVATALATTALRRTSV